MIGRAVAWAGLVAALTACDTQDLYVESNTSWAGTAGTQNVSGQGNAVLDLSNEPSNVCWSLRKMTSAGTLRAFLRDKTWFGLGTDINGDKTTTAPNGVVEGCKQ